MEVSAKRNDGINALIQQLIKIAIEEREKQQLIENNNERNFGGDGSRVSLLQRNAELDLHKRYAPKSQSCFRLPFQRCCKP
jgi:hypothetical protein